jgi:Ni/Fe-hydrogenase subunit HybB-like protein
MIDLGRYWNAFNLLLPWYAQPNSVIFEVALCVMAYITVLWLEFWPAFLERMPPAFKQRLAWIKPAGFPEDAICTC